MIVEKAPMLLCGKCGSFRVLNTDDGIECEDCYKKPIIKLKFSDEVEYLIDQMNKQGDSNETF